MSDVCSQQPAHSSVFGLCVQVGGIFMVIISFALTVISSTQQANKDYIRYPNDCLVPGVTYANR